jgi:hypothetical protein
MYLCIFPQNLYLEHVVIKDNKLVAGWVVNGAWWWVLNDQREEAYYSKDNPVLVNSWNHREFEKIVHVPWDKATFDYNAVLQWAEEQEGFVIEENSLADLLDLDALDEINLKKLYHDEDYDDRFVF